MRLVTATVAALALAVSAIAPSATAADLNSFTVDSVKALVTEAGGTNVVSETIEGVQVIGFEMGGLPFAYTLQICDPKGSGACAGILMAIGMQVDKTYALDVLNSFNRDVPVVTVVQLDANTIAFGRFLISIGGMSRENFKANMKLVGVAPELFVRHLQSQVVASTDQGQATTISAPTETAPKTVRLSPKALGRMLNEDTIKKLNLTPAK